MKETDKIFNNINGYSLDFEQRQAILTKNKYSLIVAGAGSGKTLTMIGKIKYLTQIKKVKPQNILCISFTNEATKSLKEKLNNSQIEVLTFHKLAIKILNMNNFFYELCFDNFLKETINLFFNDYCFNNPFLKKQFQKLYKKIFLGPKKYQNIINSQEFNQTKNIIKTFINLYQANNLTKNDFKTLFKKNNNSILYLIYAIMNFYEKEKLENNFLDFDDLIKEATILTEKNTPFYEEVIIDEFQDTSLLRFNFIKKLVLKNHANLTVVGDDFQSIYKFSGCDLDLFLNFSNYFPEAKIYKIQNTYRNSQELINIAGNFVMKNKYQIPKNLKSKKHLNKPIKLIKEHKKEETLLKTIKYIWQHYDKEILILGRNNNDIYKYFAKSDITWLANGYFTYNKLKGNLRYLTVHKAKGLETENVIIINMENSPLGFPCQLKDAKIIKCIKKEENFLYAEERRLFYVALTRTKNYTFLLVSKNYSIFLKEILKFKKDIEFLKID